MRRGILIALLCAVAGNAAAGWLRVGDNATFTSYVDLSTVQKTGDLVKMWILLDFKETQAKKGLSFRSMKSQIELNCEEAGAHILYFNWHSKNMGAGDVVFTAPSPAEFHSIQPNSPNATYMNIACAQANGATTPNWTAIAKNNSYTAYVNRETARRYGDVVQIWTLLDYRTTQSEEGLRFNSARSLAQYNCRQEQAKSFYTTVHAGAMGNGEIVAVYPDFARWDPVPPGSTTAGLWKTACANN